MLFIRDQSCQCSSENIDVCLIQGCILLGMNFVAVKTKPFAALEGGNADTHREIALI